MVTTLFKISKELKESSCWPLKSKASNIENSKILKIINDKLYICDCDNSRFQVLNSSLNIALVAVENEMVSLTNSRQWSRKFVRIWYNNCVQVFDCNGERESGYTMSPQCHWCPRHTPAAVGWVPCRVHHLPRTRWNHSLSLLPSGSCVVHVCGRECTFPMLLSTFPLEHLSFNELLVNTHTHILMHIHVHTHAHPLTHTHVQQFDPHTYTNIHNFR